MKKSKLSITTILVLLIALMLSPTAFAGLQEDLLLSGHISTSIRTGEYSPLTIRDSGQLRQTYDPDIYIYAIAEHSTDVDSRGHQVHEDGTITGDFTEYPSHEITFFMDIRDDDRLIKTMTFRYTSGVEYGLGQDVATIRGYPSGFSRKIDDFTSGEFLDGIRGSWLWHGTTRMFPNGDDQITLEISINDVLVQVIEYKASDLPPKGEYLVVLSATIPSATPSVPPVASSSYVAIPTNDHFVVDGKNIAPFDIIKVNSANCIKIRDAATILSGTAKQFAVGYDATSRTLTVDTAQPYTPVGGELAPIGNERVLATTSTWALVLDGVTLQPEMYSVDGNNYLPLRTLLRLIDCGVRYADGTVHIDTATPHNE